MDGYGVSTILAAHGGGSEAGALFGAIIALVGIVGAIIAAVNKSQNSVWINGLPYCPKCRRQISLKSSRPYCRSCGYNLVQPHQQPSTHWRSTPASEMPSNVALLQGEAERKARVKEQEAMAERLQFVKEQKEKQAEEARLARLAVEAEKEAKRQATFEANGGYTNLQLICAGVGIILFPLGIVGVLVYMATH